MTESCVEAHTYITKWNRSLAFRSTRQNSRLTNILGLSESRPNNVSLVTQQTWYPELQEKIEPFRLYWCAGDRNNVLVLHRRIDRIVAWLERTGSRVAAASYYSHCRVG